MTTRASELLMAVPLPQLIEGLGLAVASANAKLKTSDMVFTIDEAEVKLKVAISVDSKKVTSAGGEFGLQAFSVNASYSKTYGFKEEASSEIRLKMHAVPRDEPQLPADGSV